MFGIPNKLIKPMRERDKEATAAEVSEDSIERRRAREHLLVPSVEQATFEFLDDLLKKF